MMPKPSRSAPFWAAQRMSVGHSSLMKELQRRVPVLDYQNTEEEEDEEEERRDKERQQQGKKSVEKDDEEEKEEWKEDRVKDEKDEKGGEGIEKEECTSSKERIEQEIEEEEEEECRAELHGLIHDQYSRVLLSSTEQTEMRGNNTRRDESETR